MFLLESPGKNLLPWISSVQRPPACLGLWPPSGNAISLLCFHHHVSFWVWPSFMRIPVIIHWAQTFQDQFPTSCLQRPFCHVRFQGLRHRHLWGTSVRPTAVSLNQKIWSFEVLLILPCKEGTFCNKRWSILSQRGFPGDAYGKEPKRCGFKPWVGKIPWRRKWQPTPVFLPGESMDRGAWRVIVHRDAESTEVT